MNVHFKIKGMNEDKGLLHMSYVACTTLQNTKVLHFIRTPIQHYISLPSVCSLDLSVIISPTHTLHYSVSLTHNNNSPGVIKTKINSSNKAVLDTIIDQSEAV